MITTFEILGIGLCIWMFLITLVVISALSPPYSPSPIRDLEHLCFEEQYNGTLRCIK